MPRSKVAPPGARLPLLLLAGLLAAGAVLWIRLHVHRGEHPAPTTVASDAR